MCTKQVCPSKSNMEVRRDFSQTDHGNNSKDKTGDFKHGVENNNPEQARNTNGECNIISACQNSITTESTWFGWLHWSEKKKTTVSIFNCS